jgi:ParB-like chromosome segregation protein Spo0J
MKKIKANAKNINPSRHNPRVHLKPGDLDFEKLRQSIKEFGVVEPLIRNNHK